MLYTDADLPFDMDELAKPFALIRIYKPTSSVRFASTAPVEGPRRFIYSYVSTTFCVRCSRSRPRCPTSPSSSSTRCARPHRAEERGSFIDVELLARANASGIVVHSSRLLPSHPRRIDGVSSSVLKHIVLGDDDACVSELRVSNHCRPITRGAAARG